MQKLESENIERHIDQGIFAQTAKKVAPNRGVHTAKTRAGAKT
jgi:hypothetical protein